MKTINDVPRSNMRTSDWIRDNSKALVHLSDAIWDYAETALNEHRSAELLIVTLRRAGFRIEMNLAGMPTAFRAVWGEESPQIAFLGEYDALSGLSQKKTVRKEKRESNENGHGCGHNLLGVASLGAALALRYAMEALERKGTVVFYGCPAEETMTGKIRMSADGLFDGIDAALSWHPSDCNEVMEESFLAMRTLKYSFNGVSSHAASAPECGRSALDAVELMNVGVNYLREHVTDDVRIHYSITDGGGEPNIVSPYAQSMYYVRAASWHTVEEVVARINRIAEGAATMTETDYHVDPLTGCREILHNNVLNGLLHECMCTASLQEWSETDLDFARKLVNSLDSKAARTVRQNRDGLPGDDEVLHRGVAPLTRHHPLFFASTDVANVSWAAPTGQIWTCCVPSGIPPHSWQFTASVGMEIGHRGMLYAAQVLSDAGLRLMSDPALLKRVQDEFQTEKKIRS